MKVLIILTTLISSLSAPFTFNCDWGREKVIGKYCQPDWEWAEERMQYHGVLVAEYRSGEWYFVRNDKVCKLW